MVGGGVLKEMEDYSPFQELGKQYTGGLIWEYVSWVLKKALERKTSTLFFLARDGEILYKTAQRMVNQWELPIECKYLYCSRYALRMPSYALIGEEAYSLLFYDGYYVTRRTVLQRVSLTEEEVTVLFVELGLESSCLDDRLTKAELNAFCFLLEKNKKFNDLLKLKSRLAQEDTFSYFKQEGLLNLNEICIVDSGWTGSMQRSLRQLLDAMSYQGKISGFYFGLYNQSSDPRDGEYFSWYFSKSSGLCRKIQFSNNLLECMMAATHGMTKGYKTVDGVVSPKLEERDFREIEKVQAHQNGILSYVDERLINQQNFEGVSSVKRGRKIIHQTMVKPSCLLAKLYGSFHFCDDVSEAYQFSLAEEKQIERLDDYLIWKRIYRKLIKSFCRIDLKEDKKTELFWIFGTISFLPARKQWFYRWNVYVWEWIRLIKKN